MLLREHQMTTGGYHLSSLKLRPVNAFHPKPPINLFILHSNIKMANVTRRRVKIAAVKFIKPVFF